MAAGEVDKTQYTARMAQVFIDLANASHPTHRVVDVDVSRAHRFTPYAWVLALIAGVAALFCSAVPKSQLSGVLSHTVLLGVSSFVVMCLSLMSAWWLSAPARAQFALNACLSFSGRALPLDEACATRLAEWTSQYPSLVPTLGRWMAANPDYRLNLYDFHTVSFAIAKAARIAAQMEKAIAAHNAAVQRDARVAEQMRDMGVTAASNRLRLAEISDQADDEQARPRSSGAPRAM